MLSTPQLQLTNQNTSPPLTWLVSRKDKDAKQNHTQPASTEGSQVAQCGNHLSWEGARSQVGLVKQSTLDLGLEV